MNAMTRRIAVAATAAAVAASGAAGVTATRAATASASTTPHCSTTWGSQPKATAPALLWTGAVDGVRSGRHTCYDRLVVDIGRGAGRLGYDVRYVAAVTAPGSGLPVPVTGGARIQVTVNAPSAVGTSSTTFIGWRTFRQLRNVGSFEGYTDYGLGVRARLPLRTFVLTADDGGRRLVIDVAHAW